MDPTDPLEFTFLASILPLLPILIAIPLALYTRYLLLEPSPSRLPPGPSAHFLWGNTFPPHAWLQMQRWSETYGEIFTVYNGMAPCVVVAGYEAAMEILERGAKDTSDRPVSVMAGENMSGGKRILLVQYGERWRRLRKMLHQGLQPKMAASYEPIQEKAARVLMRDIIENPDQSQNHAKKYAASVIMTITYGTPPLTSYNDPSVIAVNKCLGRLGSALRPSAYLVDAYPFLRYLPFGSWRAKGAQWHREELALFRKQMEGVNDMLWRGEETGCFAAYILEHQKEYGLSDDEAAYLAGSSFGAGSDTTASAISIAIMAMTLHPRATKKAQDEIDAVVGRSRLPTFSDLSSLPYLTNFISEVHRWRPVSSAGFTHRTTSPITYKSYLIPSGTTILGSHYCISRDPSVFPDPEEFDPERWEGEGKLRHVGFGLGRRVCAGKNVAERSIFINCALLLWSFNFSKKVDVNGQPIEIDSDMSTGFSDSANTHPLLYQVSMKPREGVVEMLEELESVDSM